jgi:hypothetical protein
MELTERSVQKDSLEAEREKEHGKASNETEAGRLNGCSKIQTST